MPPLSAFPRPQQVTFKYYEGVLAFLDENYVEVSTPAKQWPTKRDMLTNR